MDSASLRKQGNVFFKRLNNNLAPVLFSSNATKARSHYQQAFDCAISDEDKSSACRNVSACAVKVADRHEDVAQVNKQRGRIVAPTTSVKSCRTDD